jgi:hypothetical protein
VTTRKRDKRTERKAPQPDKQDDKTAGIVLARHEQMYATRGNFNTLWQTVAERVRPNQADFTTKWAEGQRRTNRVFDDTAPMAVENGVAALESLLCPSSRQWHGLAAKDKDLQGKLIVRQWLEQVTDTLFGVRYAPTANFQSQIHETLGDIMTFGNGPFLVDDVVGVGIRYRSLPLAYTFGMENAVGMIDVVHREWDMTPRAVQDAYNKGIIDEVPDQIADEYVQKQNSEKTWTFIHCIEPNDGDYDDVGNAKPISSFIVCKQTQQTVKRGGYYTQPIMIPRYRVNSRETYGRGPCVDVLPTILQLNEMEKADIRITQRAADPPYLTVDNINLPAFNLRSNSVNAGYLTPDGKELIRPLPSGSKFDVLKDKLEMKQAVVRRACLNDIISILSEHPNMTATQVLQLAQERGYLVAPIIGRIQNELMGPIITRELDILHRAGQLPEPPQVLRGRKVDIDIQYTSFSQTAQKQSKALAINMTLQQAAPLFQAQPDLMTRMINLPRTFEELAMSNDAPPGILNTSEEQQAMDQQAIQQQQLTNMAQLAGPASQAIKNLSDASKGGSSITPGAGLGG